MKASLYAPQTPEEKIEGISVLLPLSSRQGFIFLVAKTQKTSHQDEYLLQTLSDQVHRLAETFGSDANAQQRFEHFLGALNETVAQQVREGRIRVPIQQFDAIVGIASEHRMYLSGTGDICALFLHCRSHERYQIFNLSRSIQTEQSLPTWEKAFAVVLDGDLHDGDVFALCNHDLQRAVPTEDLHAILTTLPPSGATQKLRPYFPVRSAMLLLILAMPKKPDPARLSETRATPKTDISINRFKEQEEATAQLLEDQSPKIATLVQAVKKQAQRLLKKAVWRLLLHSMRRFFKSFLKTGARFKTKDGRAEVSSWFISLTSRARKGIQVLWYKTKRVPRATKYLAAGVVAIVAILAVSISVLSSARTQAQDAKAYVSQTEKIEDLMERASAALIYKDENQARGLYLNAAALIEQLPTNTQERQEKQTAYKMEMQKATDDIRHLVTVPNPALLGDLASITDGVFGQAFVKVGPELFVFGSDGRVYQLDRTQKVFKIASTATERSRLAISASEEDGRIYALLNDQAVVQLIRDESVQKQIAVSIPEGRTVDLMAYANRLYFLTVTETDGQLYRSGKTSDGFGAPSGWIASKTTPLTDARSVAIDGSVYILLKDGKVARFENSAQMEYETGVVDPPITNALDLWTDGESKYLYILEPDTKRIVVYDKQTGAFVVQYRSEAFQNASDLIVDEAGYSVYVLAGSKLYSIAPSHIAR
ncbi:hypothetical protein FJZ23_00600 [Candidatus Parcubacteria bacterium]|nr:hypothetical protein [Candidatus Parcubacteria bacterium]